MLLVVPAQGSAEGYQQLYHNSGARIVRSCVQSCNGHRWSGSCKGAREWFKARRKRVPDWGIAIFFGCNIFWFLF